MFSFLALSACIFSDKNLLFAPSSGTCRSSRDLWLVFKRKGQLPGQVHAEVQDVGQGCLKKLFSKSYLA